MQTIFLDFDGVLHPVTAISGLHPHDPRLFEEIKSRDMFRWLPLLEEVLHSNEDITIAVHSSWKQYLSNQQMHEILGPLAARYIGTTPIGTGRYHGIIELVERAQVESYIIIDDATDEFPHRLPELIATNPLTGISEKNTLEKIHEWVLSAAYNNTPAVNIRPSDSC